MKLVGQASILSFDPFQNTNNDATAAEQQNLGEVAVLGDGRTFRYVKAGGSNTAQGKLELAPAPKTNHHNISPSATALIGATTVSVTLGATAAVADEYDEGFLAINVTPGQGQVYRISYNPAIGSAGTGNITLADPIVGANLTTSTKLSLVHNQWNGVVEAASATRRAAGVGLVGLTASNFGWVQTKGVASVLADGAVALGSLVVASGSVAGAVAIGSSTFGTYLATTEIGQAQIMALVDTEYRPAVLDIR